MHWALHAVNVGDSTIKAALEAERDHFLATSPIPTAEIVDLSDAVRKSYGGPPEITAVLVDSRNRRIEEHPHPDTPQLIEQMDGAIAAAVAVLAHSPQDDLVNVTI